MSQETIHATCISINGNGLLLRGPSGCGKSDLALRLIGQGAKLVADDRVVLAAHQTQLIASGPKVLAGFMEVRGIGLVQMETLASSPIHLIVDLVDADQVARLPELASETLSGIEIPRMALYAFETSATAKILIALDVATGERNLKQ